MAVTNKAMINALEKAGKKVVHGFAEPTFNDPPEPHMQGFVYDYRTDELLLFKHFDEWESFLSAWAAEWIDADAIQHAYRDLLAHGKEGS